MAKENKEMTVKAPAGPVDVESFKKFVKRIVNKETQTVLDSLTEEGAMIGKKLITKTVSKYVLRRIIHKVVLGDNGTHSTTDRSREKIRAFAKSYLIHTFTKHTKDPSSG